MVQLDSTVFERHHVADIADYIAERDFDDQYDFIKRLSPEQAGAVFDYLPIGHQVALATQFSHVAMSRILPYMSQDIATDLLNQLDTLDTAGPILNRLPRALAQRFRQLLQYPDDTAGGIMQTDMISIPASASVTTAIQLIRRQADSIDRTHGFQVFITDKQVLTGTVLLASVLLADDTELIHEIASVQKDPISVPVHLPTESVAAIFQKYDLSVLPVLDDNQQLVGVITSDSVLDVIIDEATEDIYKLSGTSDVSETQLLTGSLWWAIRSRLSWLVLTIIGGLGSAMIIRLYTTYFTPVQFSLAVSLSFIPLLMGLGGNMGNQSATIIVRSLSTGFIKPDQTGRYIIRELCIGLVIATSLAIGLYSLMWLIGYSLILCTIVAIALFLNITVASTLGAGLPVVFNKVAIDPAIASAPFISMSLDIISQLIYFALTLWVIQYFL